jgi:SAM-dependent methyltransferase
MDVQPVCRFCGARLSITFVDLGMSPLCESYLGVADLNKMEPFYPLHVFVCGKCFLVQLQEYVAPENIFSEYAYFSSYSDSWVEHARQYAQGIVTDLQLDSRSLVYEIASNDGYLLQHFVNMGIPVMGVEPAANVARVAEGKGIPTVVRFFGTGTAEYLRGTTGPADLIIGNNVLAHVPDLNDFVAGLKVLLKPTGTVTMEFPHLVRLIDGNQFDTIYHEHFSYLSLMTVRTIFTSHGLRIYHVDEIPTHGGSLRIRACHDTSRHESTGAVERLIDAEVQAGLADVAGYATFAEQVEETKRALLDFLIAARRDKRRIAGYGAPGKGNTLLNYCGIRTDFVEYTVDRNPYKHGKYLPGTHIPIFSPDRIRETRPDYVLILPWNLTDEIVQQLNYVRAWGAQFVVPIPTLKVF